MSQQFLRFPWIEAKRRPRVGHGARPLPEEKAMGESWSEGSGGPGPRSLGQPATRRVAAIARPARSVDRQVGWGGDPGSGKPFASGLFDAAGWGGAGDSTGVCADVGASEPLCE